MHQPGTFPLGVAPRSTGTERRRACAFYATDDDYALAALVAAARLQHLGLPDGVEVVLLHGRISHRLLEAFRQQNVRLLARPDPPSTRGPAYGGCLMKLDVLGLEEYSRVVFLDADGLPLRRLDALFEVPLRHPVAAPLAYWLPVRMYSSMLLVVEPSRSLWERARPHAAEAYRLGHYDMDVLNEAFGGEIMPLPAHWACLSSEWDDRNGPFQFGAPETTSERALYVHFTAVGKPWFWRPEEIARRAPGAHPFFHELWRQWWDLRDELLSETRRERLARQALYGLGMARVRNAVRRLRPPSRRQLPGPSGS